MQIAGCKESDFTLRTGYATWVVSSATVIFVYTIAMWLLKQRGNDNDPG